MALVNFKFDDTSVPFTKKMSSSFTNKQNENETEGGHTIIQTFRKDILTMKISTTCLSSWAKIYHEFSKKDSFVLSFFDTATEQQVTRTVHMEGYSESMVWKSHKLDSTNGLYDVSFTLEEF